MTVEQTDQKQSGSGSPPSAHPKLRSEAALSNGNTKKLVVSLRDTKIDPTEKPYSIYTTSEKWFIVSVVSLAVLFSPLTANIYFPAIPAIATSFHKSDELINLTVTVYMVLQGVSPMFWGSLADRIGRRLILLACLLVLSAACVGLALVPTSDFWLLMLLRCVQASGSASTVALGAGVIGDIATRGERGSFFALFNFGLQLGPTVGPVIGGAVVQALGWRWIFWLLCILSVACGIVMIMFLPETLRLLVGDGSILPSRIHQPIFLMVGAGRHDAKAKLSPSPPLLNPFRIFTYIDVMNLLLFNGTVYSIFYAVMATLSILFQQTYPFLNDTETGLCYLAIGGGTVIGGLTTGPFLDKDYKKTKKKIAREVLPHKENPLTAEEVGMDESFPIERTRMRMVFFHLLICTGCCAGYGWSLQKKVNIAVPLVLQVVFAISRIAMTNTVQILLIDLLPTHGASVTACNNLVRCSMGAATVSVIEFILGAVGIGWTYTIIAGIGLATAPMIWFAFWIGPRCRAKRYAKHLGTH